MVKEYLCLFRTAVGIRGKDGVVFGVEKLVTSKLYEAGANKRIFNIDRHIGIVCEFVLLFIIIFFNNVYDMTTDLRVE